MLSYSTDETIPVQLRHAQIRDDDVGYIRGECRERNLG
jgi:hypothetical protein